ncbi:MAG: ABC transporter ATP-binding protein [Hyphomicrobium sp.]|jgi:ATP-binding cassette subfamily B multidrug efflux pump
MFQWFESRIEAFPGGGDVRPPAGLGAFYWHFVRQCWPAFAALLVVGFAGAVIEASLFAFVGTLVDRMREARTPATFLEDHANLLLWMAFVAVIARPICSALIDLVKHQMIGGNFTTRIRWQSHAYVLRQSLGFFQNDFAGRVASKVMQTGPALRESVVQLIDALWFVAVYWLSAIVLFADADIRLIAPLFVWIVFYSAALWYFVPRLKEKAVATSEARSMLTGRIVDSYTNILTVKLFAHTEREDAYARDAMDEQLEKLKSQLRLTTWMEVVVMTLNGGLIVGMVGLALALWSENAVTLGAIALISGLTIRIVNMSTWVMWTLASLFENLGVVHEGMETISRPHEILDAPGAKPISVSRGEVVFDNVTFSYGRAEPRRTRSNEMPASLVPSSLVDVAGEPIHGMRPGGVINGLSLRIAPGEKIGLVGRSGAGKSTLVSILLRFYDLEAGRILIDGQDIALVAQDSLRAGIGLVTQDTSLLHRSVMDNILYGRPEAGEAAAITAAKRAHAHEFIQGLEDLRGRKGYAAQVGERGVKLSGGQRQRIAIARVLLKNAPILVLDEATSALDSEVEAAIQESLSSLMAGKTVIAIAHRLSTIAQMDRLVILDHGCIVEEGRHAELLRRDGLYASLWARQSGGFLSREAAE